ncbi:histidinol-phosphate transaminase [Anaerobacillus sp. CMMVII]|uniref:histidinol-phosphate transaminase n=1 Tax=Anaerobacillus sp. CMMVII TaxID=2755588 RepID=UPI0021B7A617|nr:histidinol-phosphate transaminase [Anaerobacillus sp. CMMVII]MCT8138901.1 histidinol-phosphate transaminase [Anaerobacillus sp. CMMVII]
MKVKQQLIGLPPYKPGKPIEEVKKQFGLAEVIKLASNENPFGCSKFAKQAISEALDNLAIYPDGYAATIRTDVANVLKVKEDQLIFGNGSDEIIQILCRALLSPETNTVCAVPSFPQYKHNAVIEGAEVREVTLINGVHDLEGMLAQIDENTRIVWVCNPNNPSGTYVSAEKFKEFIARVPKDVLVVSDEAYYEYVVAEDYPETIPLLKEYENLMVLRTFSKAYGLASLRIGYGVGNPQFIEKIEPAREPFNTSLLAQVAASAALGDQQFISSCKSQNREGLEQFYSFCNEYKLDYYPSQGNFILIDLKKPGNDSFNYLLARGFIVRSGEALGFPTSLRITVGNARQNDAIIEELKNFLNS